MAVPLWKRLLYWLSPEYRPIQTRLNEAEAIGLAQSAAARLGRIDFSAVSAGVVRNGQRVLWDIWTNRELRDASTHIVIDDATGEILECRVVGRGRDSV